MAEVTKVGPVTYVNHWPEIRDQALRPLVEAFVESAAATIRDEIVLVMKESNPSGRHYRLPATTAPYKRDGERIEGKWYQASAPGEPPAMRTSTYARNWRHTQPEWTDDGTVRAAVTNDTRVGKSDEHLLWIILELGTTPILGGLRVQHVIAPRPHVSVGVQRALPKIRSIADGLDL